MSANNPFYGEMEHNPICINIPWYDNNKQLEAYMNGNTGYPFIDAGVRQMKSLSCQRCPQNIFMNARYLLIIIYLFIDLNSNQRCYYSVCCKLVYLQTH